MRDEREEISGRVLEMTIRDLISGDDDLIGRKLVRWKAMLMRPSLNPLSGPIDAKGRMRWPGARRARIYPTPAQSARPPLRFQGKRVLKQFPRLDNMAAKEFTLCLKTSADSFVVKGRSKRVNFQNAEAALVCEKSDKPTLVYHLLKGLARNHGEISAKLVLSDDAEVDQKLKRNLNKNVSLLRQLLKVIFNIDEDPFEEKSERGKVWKAKFHIVDLGGDKYSRDPVASHPQREYVQEEMAGTAYDGLNGMIEHDDLIGIGESEEEG